MITISDVYCSIFPPPGGGFWKIFKLQRKEEKRKRKEKKEEREEKRKKGRKMNEWWKVLGLGKKMIFRVQTI